jgi:ABC-type multidrug transport system fused ATPase/permease subunit
VRAGSYGQQVQSCYQLIRQSLPYIERLQEATDRYLASEPPTGDLPMGPVRTLAFDRVSYAYHRGRPVLSEISYEVAGGETIGIVGPSGAGKSTMVQLLLGLRSPDDGEYMINGYPTAEYTREDWSRRVAYVPQQPRLIYASVADNVRFYRAIDDKAVERACRQARIHDEIMSWAKGYDTIVGPRAEAVSGGQQQRICLARALAAEPQVLVLDEPTSALDPRSEALIQESLAALKESLTLFIIAHRMSTLTICDRVMVILDGGLNAFDTVQELQTSNPYYRHASSLSMSNWNSE